MQMYLFKLHIPLSSFIQFYITHIIMKIDNYWAKHVFIIYKYMHFQKGFYKKLYNENRSMFD